MLFVEIESYVYKNMKSNIAKNTIATQFNQIPNNYTSN